MIGPEPAFKTFRIKLCSALPRSFIIIIKKGGEKKGRKKAVSILNNSLKIALPRVTAHIPAATIPSQ